MLAGRRLLQTRVHLYLVMLIEARGMRLGFFVYELFYDYFSKVNPCYVLQHADRFLLA